MEKKDSDEIKMKIIPLFLIILMLFIVSGFSKEFYPDIRQGYGVTDIKWLSEYFPKIEGTNVDTQVYFMTGEATGATFLLMGGTHPRELAGTVSAVAFLENAIVKVGTVIVIPFSNISAASIPDLTGKISHFLPVQTKSGERYLVFGDRRTDINDEEVEDPEEFVHPSGVSVYRGNESRNLNRSYPGEEDGNLTSQLAYAIMNLIVQEEVDFNLDMHESRTPEEYKKSGSDYNLSYSLVCNPKALEMGILSMLNLEIETGINIKLEESAVNQRGLSHLEIGNNTNSLSFLSETPNPAQDSSRVNVDPLYDEQYPLKHRIGLQLEIIQMLMESYNMLFEEHIEVENLPSYNDLMEYGFEEYLN